ncbi:PBP1A family penicillin-binding protein [Patescibacteria group bacterium]|nr:PBP1A family penicillin-binding protein [Patescibacteria group bacterium]
MPISQLSQKKQSWRKEKAKKYYIDGRRNNQSGWKKHSTGPGKYKFRKHQNAFAFFLMKRIAILFAIIGLLATTCGFIIIVWITKDIPDPHKLMEREITQSTKIFDRTGKTVLYEIYGEEERTIVNLSEIPDYAKWATIAIEDKNFYKHQGFSALAMLRTLVTNILYNKKAGGSTLTQQFIKNAILTSEKTYTRKIKELVLAYKVEKNFSKDEILQMYFNEIPYGSTAYGIEAASQRYFGKSIRNINLPEAVILATLPQAPSRYSPYGPNKDLLIQRQHYILDLMLEQGYISEAKVEAAKQYKLKFKKPSANITAPHFVMYVKGLLSEKYGEKMIEREGLRIYTTLDLYKQKIAEEVVEDGMEKNKQYNANNSALTAIDPKTGEILAMVGSSDYFNEEIDGQVNITTSSRQPGSSIKPIVYAAAFENGYTPDTVLYDVVTNFSNNADEPYEPHNYDLKEHGPVTMKKALAGSLNIPAVKTLYLAGVNNVLDLAENLGYTTLSDRKRFGLSLVLGGGEVKLIEHVNAYSAFSREGKIYPITAILKVEDKNGHIIEESKSNKNKQTLKPETARIINNILSNNELRAYTFGTENWLTLGNRPVAAKTGTTNDYRDAWTIGYTPSIVVGVWVGNSDNTAMKRGAAGGVVAASIWNSFMKKVLGDTPIEYFNSPKDIKTGKPILDGETQMKKAIKIDKASGLLATEWTPESFIEERFYQEHHCLLYYANKNKPLEATPENPDNDPQFHLWENRVLAWAEKNKLATSSPPTEYDNVHKSENRPLFNIVQPTNNQIIAESLFISNIQASAPRGINRAEYYINDNLLSINKTYPFNLEKNISFLNNGYYKLTVQVCDDIDNCSKQSLEFNLILDQQQNNNDIIVSWLEPSNGVAISNIDFPLNLKFNINNPQKVVKINMFAVNNSEENSSTSSLPVLLEVLQSIDNTIIESKLQKDFLLPGTYKIYAEIHTWDGQIQNSEGVIINMQ